MDQNTKIDNNCNENFKSFTSPSLRILNTKQTAELLGICPRTLWTLTNSKQIPHFRIGRACKYVQDDIEAWIEKRKREAQK